MYCKKCGKETPGDAKFCDGCGQPLEVLTNDSSQYGGFWIRFSAYVIDGVIVLISTLLASFLLRATYPADNTFVYADTIMSLTIAWVYAAVLHSSSWQATLGKKLLGLKVVDYEGARISFGRATGRYFAELLSLILLGIGFIMVAFTKKKQALHDKMAGTLVVRSAFIMKRWIWIAGIVGIVGIVGVSAVGDWWANQDLSTDSTTRDGSGQISEAGDLGAFKINVGDCILSPGESVEFTEEFTKLVGVPCTELHDAEIVGAITLPEGDFPGEDSLDGVLNEFCVPAYEKYVGIPYDTDAPHVIYLFNPTADSWAQGDREVLCYASLTSGEQMGASIRD